MHRFFKAKNITSDMGIKLTKLDMVAKGRGQTLSEIAISWLLKDQRVTSSLIGARSVAQLKENLKAVDEDIPFSKEELDSIDALTP